jgi:hypothetical protein
VIVSEERKTVSIAVDGDLENISDIAKLKERLTELMGKGSVAGSMKEILKETGSEVETVYDIERDKHDGSSKNQ